MYRTALRSASRPVISSLRANTARAVPRRLASTASPTDKARTWKGSAVRLGLAVAAVYYYNTSPVFAEEAAAKTIPAPAAFSGDDLPTVDSVIEQKRKQIQSRPEQPTEKKPEAPQTDAQSSVAATGSPAALEEEAGQQGAFNPETGEINWDCPCLGGMADGPCGEEFKTAFSCFVHSEEEPKGMDCIDKFQGMQECFKKYPEIYGAELADDDDEGAPEAEGLPVGDTQKTAVDAPVSEAQKSVVEKPVEEAKKAAFEPASFDLAQDDQVDKAAEVTEKVAKKAAPAVAEAKKAATEPASVDLALDEHKDASPVEKE
ncbi:Fc.00g084340.m01.CDS01 [Cosmosporella sp. VM-42]